MSLDPSDSSHFLCPGCGKPGRYGNDYPLDPTCADCQAESLAWVFKRVFATVVVVLILWNYLNKGQLWTIGILMWIYFIGIAYYEDKIERRLSTEERWRRIRERRQHRKERWRLWKGKS